MRGGGNVNKKKKTKKNDKRLIGKKIRARNKKNEYATGTNERTNERINERMNE